ncbi:hypothetical protein BCV69DRAFT_297721 [Microstroma glucosiphilum]|uniref:Uncharacterized protein n=1 Tax=Pseudomicrostroma glucosiphilum TaxID=1684307 RepID=A0A316UB88_9BASI|nr:hypothetical protein BCV69DRAFT_297721 [Pseudomicrostroma glucosiphilum]PWN22429.1 hypothetical protein BCV69DRAFT_297721 [Pseudomicrostroma glucosiphilum]
MPQVATIAQRGTVLGLVGMSVWGIWLTAAVWKSRRGEGAMQGPRPGQLPEAPTVVKEHPLHAGQGGKGHTV